MSFRRTFAPMLLAALSTVAAAHPGSAEESRIHIETDSTEARIEFCLTKEDCKSIYFSGMIPEKAINKEVNKNPSKENQNNSLIKQINDHVFGLLGF